MITLYRLSKGSTMVSLKSIPSVRYLILVRVLEDTSSNLMVYPTFGFVSCTQALRYYYRLHHPKYNQRPEGEFLIVPNKHSSVSLRHFQKRLSYQSDNFCPSISTDAIYTPFIKSLAALRLQHGARARVKVKRFLSARLDQPGGE